MGTGDRIARERNAQDLSQGSLADKVTRLGRKISQTGIDKIEKRNSERPRALPEIARALGVTEKWLLTGQEPKKPPPVPSTGPVTDIPLLSWVSAGELSRNDVADAELGQLTMGGLDPRGDWVGLKVEGDSMDRISPPDSIILVNRKEKRLTPNACYVLADLDGNATYKRYRPGPPPRFEAVSSTPGHEPIFYENEPAIIGRVRRTILDM